MSGRSRIELVKDLAYPLPMTVIAELLGVPTRERGRFKAWADALLSQDNLDPTNPEALEFAAVNLRKFQDYLTDLVQRRRRKPRPDLLSDLIAAEIDGQRLGDSDIAGFAAILLIAGHVTTTSLLGNTVLCLDEHPEDQDALRRDPARIPKAIEEALRYRSPITQVTRVTTREVQLGEQVIPTRQILFLWLASANHDERQFARSGRIYRRSRPESPSRVWKRHSLLFGSAPRPPGSSDCPRRPLAPVCSAERRPRVPARTPRRSRI